MVHLYIFFNTLCCCNTLFYLHLCVVFLYVGDLIYLYAIVCMLLRIVSAEWELYRGQVDKAILPTETGMIGIFPWHENLTTILVLGDVSYVPSQSPSSVLDSFADHTHTIAIGGGLAMIEDDIITVAAE